MFETFATIASVIYFIGYTLLLGQVVYQFSQLSTYAQDKASIHISPFLLMIYLASIAWLITKAIS